MLAAHGSLAGHQLHFDSDDEGQGGVRHPIITAIVYLSDNTSPAQTHPTRHAGNGTLPDPTDSNRCQNCDAGGQGSSSCSCKQQDWVGGPTLMTDQVLGGPLASQGWLAYPATNRVVFFDGRYLHGEEAAAIRYQDSHGQASCVRPGPAAAVLRLAHGSLGQRKLL